MGSRRVLKVTDGGRIEFSEVLTNGTSKISMKAPDSLAADYTFTLPSTAGTSGYLLKTDGSGVLSYQDPSTVISIGSIPGIKPLSFYQKVGTGQWYTVGDVVTSALATGTATFLEGFLQAQPFAVMEPMTFDRIQIFVDTGGDANSKARLGVYSPISATNPLPGSLISDLGEVSTAGTGFVPLTINLSVATPQLLLFAIVVTDAGGAHPALGGEILNNNFLGHAGVARNELPFTHCSRAFTYGALPSTFGGVTTHSAAVVPRMMVRRSA